MESPESPQKLQVGFRVASAGGDDDAARDAALALGERPESASGSAPLRSPARSRSALSAAFSNPSPPTLSPGGCGDGDGPLSDDDDDDDDEDEYRVNQRRIPDPRDPNHYKAMVYARAILNAKMMQLWAAQA